MIATTQPTVMLAFNSGSIFFTGSPNVTKKDGGGFCNGAALSRHV